MISLYNGDFFFSLLFCFHPKTWDLWVVTAVYTHRELRSSVQQSLAGVGQEPAPHGPPPLPPPRCSWCRPAVPHLPSPGLGFALSSPVPGNLYFPGICCVWWFLKVWSLVQQHEYHPRVCWKRSFLSSISDLLSQTPWGGACSLGCKKPPRWLGCMLKSRLWWVLVWKRSAYEEIRIHLRKWAPGSSRSLTCPRTN